MSKEVIEDPVQVLLKKEVESTSVSTVSKIELKEEVSLVTPTKLADLTRKQSSDSLSSSEEVATSVKMSTCHVLLWMCVYVFCVCFSWQRFVSRKFRRRVDSSLSQTAQICDEINGNIQISIIEYVKVSSLL